MNGNQNYSQRNNNQIKYSTGGIPPRMMLNPALTVTVKKDTIKYSNENR